MCDCFNKLAQSHGNMGSTKEVLYHLFEVIAQYFTHEKPGLYFRVLDFACEAYERVVLKQEPDVVIGNRHCCEEVDRLIAYLAEVDRLHHYVERTNFRRSPRLNGRVRRALLKGL